MAVAATTRALPPAHGAGLVSLKAHFALLAASALMLVLVFPEPGWGWLAHVALVPMTLLALRSASARRLAWTAYAVAFAWWLLMIRWLVPVTFPGYVALCAYLAIYTPLTLLLLRWLHRRYLAPMVLTLPLAWVSLEMVRCHAIEGGFAWFALGHSQLGHNPSWTAPKLAQLADLFGQHGVSFVVAMTNGLIVDLLTRPLFRRLEGGRSHVRHTMRLALAAWAVAFFGGWFYGLYRVRTTQFAELRPRIAVIQTNVPQDNKNRRDWRTIEADWARLLELTVAAARDEPGLDLIVWPETVVPAALNPEAIEFYRTTDTGHAGLEMFHEQVAELATLLGVPLLVGASSEADWRVLTQEVRAAQNYNSAFLYEPEVGQAAERYSKIHRVPFGEFIPFIDRVPALKDAFLRHLSPYDFDYTLQPGTDYTLFRIAVGEEAAAAAGGRRVRFATPICFEDASPFVTRRMVYEPGAGKRADLLVNLTNDGWFAFAYDAPWLWRWYGAPVRPMVRWFATSHQAAQQLQIAAFRCIENRVPMARSVNTGISGFIDSLGRIGPVVQREGRRQMVDGWTAHAVPIDDRLTLFGRIGHAPAIGVCIITALLALAALLPRRRERAAAREARAHG